MSTNHQPGKFSFIRSLRFDPVRLVLTAVLLAGFIGGGSETEAVVPSESSKTQTVGDCYEWHYINGEWTLVRVPC